jgi:vacuole morphology and inheritance protein 14
LYDKRKIAALELEQTIRDCLTEGDRDKIKAIIDQLCRDFAYAVHHPNARNGGLIGLAAAAIALGPNEVAIYLEDIIHPVLACFGDQDARVRYYACESMYNIAKVAKGEILLYFNEIFDALCKLATDSETSVKNGADLLDRLIKDIVSEKAATYVSIAPKPVPLSHSIHSDETDPSRPTLLNEPAQDEASFSLAKFIPLLMERIYVINPFARMFLVSWITLLDSIPDLELISYLPSFLGGLISFLSDPSKDVRVATHSALDGFLHEIRRVTELQKTVAQARVKSSAKDVTALSKGVSKSSAGSQISVAGKSEASSAHEDGVATARTSTEQSIRSYEDGDDQAKSLASQPASSIKEETVDGDDLEVEDDLYIPGQDVSIKFDKIIEILISHLDSSEEEIQLTVLSWLEDLLDVSPLSILTYVPRLLSVLLPAMADEGQKNRLAADRVNTKMLGLIMSLPSDNYENSEVPGHGKLDYSATVNALTLHFLNENEQTRVAALDWLIMLHRKVPRRILAINDGTFPALLKTLSDPSEQVVTKDLQLLAQISYNSDDEYFTVFMVNLLNLFNTDRGLLETRGNLIIRQLCISLNPERIYRTLGEILEHDDDLEFASVMVSNLNSNLITAPELFDLRARLRSLDAKEGAQLFVSLFKSWCHNSIAALSLCLLAQAYEHAFLVLQIIVEFEITVNLLVQIDKLVQLLESPVFTQLRMQLLEPEKYPFLYKCLYGILMILPQSQAFTILRNRLNSVSSIGYVHTPNRPLAVNNSNSNAGKPRITGKDDIKWNELLDKFRTVQQRLQASRNLAFSKSNEIIKSYNTNDDKLEILGRNGQSYRRSDKQISSSDRDVERLAGRGLNRLTLDSDSATPIPPKPPGGIKRFASRGPFGLKTDKKK